MQLVADHVALTKTSDAYWYALRWNDAETAAQAWSDPTARMTVTRMVTDPELRLTDFAVLKVEVGPTLPLERAPVTREGVALVRVEGYATGGTRLVTETIQQHWVKLGGVGWTIDGQKSPLGEDRPWVPTE